MSLRKHIRKCGVTGKIRFDNGEQAQVAMKRIRADITKRGKKKPRRIYYCAHCKGVHLTSHPYVDDDGQL